MGAHYIASIRDRPGFPPPDRAARDSGGLHSVRSCEDDTPLHLAAYGAHQSLLAGRSNFFSGNHKAPAPAPRLILIRRQLPSLFSILHNSHPRPVHRSPIRSPMCTCLLQNTAALTPYALTPYSPIYSIC